MRDKIKALLDAECKAKQWQSCEQIECVDGLGRVLRCAKQCWMCHHNDLLAEHIHDAVSGEIDG